MLRKMGGRECWVLRKMGGGSVSAEKNVVEECRVLRKMGVRECWVLRKMWWRSVGC